MLQGRLWINPGLRLDYQRPTKQLQCAVCGEPLALGRCKPEKCGIA